MIFLIATFMISAAALGLELVLVRALSVGHWHHFSYLVISTALLGFGAGGTLVATGSAFFTRHCRKALWLFALAFGVGAPIVFSIAQKVPFDELQLIWDRRQILYLLAYYLLFFVPFLCAGSFIALAFTAFGAKAHRLYFYNMAGSALGAAGVVALMYGGSPESVLVVTSLMGFVSAAVVACAVSRRAFVATVAAAVICVWSFCPAGPFALKVDISQHKSLVYYTNLPAAETLAVRYSPLARLDCVQAPAIRLFPGLSFSYQGELPRQMLIISDADATSAVNNFKQLKDLDCYDYTTSALGYHLLNRPRVCIIGAGGGSDVAQALAMGAGSVTAVEMNRQIVDLVRSDFNDFACGLYRRDDVEIVTAEGRNFLETTSRLFDIINISLLDSFSASAAGLYALNESHLYTVEAVRQALAKLRPNGLLSVTRVLKTPARDSLKMLATAAEVLRSQSSITDPAKHVIMLRSWATATIIVSPQPFSAEQIEKARRFARQRSFDLVHLPGIEPDQVNQFHVLEEGPIYYRCAQQIFSVDYQEFYDDYPYDIRPATDDRPYFFDFFKWKSVPHMMRTLGRNWLIFTEWGYLVLLATLLQAGLAGTLLVLLPLWFAKPIGRIRQGKAPTLFYFLLLGFAYMFLEMGFIQKMTLLIGHPVYGVAVTLVGFLLFSGLGALAAERVEPVFSRVAAKASSLVRAAVLAIIIVGAAEILLMRLGFEWLIGFPLAARIVLGLIITGLPAFFMGMPLPTVLKQLHIHTRPLVPWAWAVNGFASVTGAVLGTILAISVGFTALTIIALFCYLGAALISNHVCGAISTEFSKI